MVNIRDFALSDVGAVMIIEKSAHPAGHWTTVLAAVGVPAGAVNNISEAFAFAARLGLQPIQHTEDGDSRLARIGSRTPAVPDWA